MEDCVFCKIVQGEIPASLVHASGSTIAFLDVNPRARGHTLVVPRRHVASLLQLSDTEINNLFGAVRFTAKRLLDELGADGFNLVLNNGEVAGQVVPHLHVHIIPRYNGETRGVEELFKIDEELKDKVAKMPKELIGNLSDWI
ncbi:MAG: HIT family protein [Methermicoccaceae archaeon]